MQLLRILNKFRDLDPAMPVQQLATFLVVAANPDISVKSVGDMTEQSSSSTSRNLAAFSKINRLGRPGFDLLRLQEDMTDRRFKTVNLTPKGARFAEKIANMMGNIKQTEGEQT